MKIVIRLILLELQVFNFPQTSYRFLFSQGRSLLLIYGKDLFISTSPKKEL